MPEKSDMKESENNFFRNDCEFSRRDALILLGGLTASFCGGSSYAQLSGNPADLIKNIAGDGKTFSVDALLEIARQLAQSDYQEDYAPIPNYLTELSLDKFKMIMPSPSSMIWGTNGHLIGIQPLHRGSVFSNRVALYTIENNLIQKIRYNQDQFQFNGIAPPESKDDYDFSGFAISCLDNNGKQSVFCEFQGGTFFHCKAFEQQFGTMARALLISPADNRGEEIPKFRAFWIRQPNTGENTLICYGLIDSPSAVVLVQFSINAGSLCVSDVETTLFPRMTLNHIGFVGLSSSFLFGGTRRAPYNDPRPAVHKSEGLQVLTGKGEWLWRPLNNPDSLQISAFVDHSPKGFGLLQKKRYFEAYMDEIHHYEQSPSTWIEPYADWDKGVVQLIEVPSGSEKNENILVYWKPDQIFEKGQEYSFSYRINWCWQPPVFPPLATVSATLVGNLVNDPQSPNRHFVVDFNADGLPVLNLSDIHPLIETSDGVVKNQKITYLPEQGIYRVRFDLKPENAKLIELRLALKRGDLSISETWLYRWIA